MTPLGTFSAASVERFVPQPVSVKHIAAAVVNADNAVFFIVTSLLRPELFLISTLLPFV